MTYWNRFPQTSQKEPIMPPLFSVALLLMYPVIQKNLCSFCIDRTETLLLSLLSGYPLCAASRPGLCTPPPQGRDLPHHHLHRPFQVQSTQTQVGHCVTFDIRNMNGSNIVPLPLIHGVRMCLFLLFSLSLARSIAPVFSPLSPRSKVQRQGWSEEQLLECSRSEESLLDKLPCLYRSVSPDAWYDKTTLLTTLRSIIWEEQKKIVWVEPDLW